MSKASQTDRTALSAGLCKAKSILFDRPYLQIIVMSLVLWLIANLGTNLFSSLLLMIPAMNSSLSQALGAILTAFLLVAVNQFCFKGQVPITIGIHGLGKALLLGFPIYAVIIWNAVGTGGTDLTVSAIGIAILEGMVPGFIEEMAFRGITLPHAMRGIRKEHEVLFVAALSSFMFGAIHLLSLTTEFNLRATSFQVFSAIGTGMLYSAIYLRTGNILSTILFHSFFDAAADLSIGQGFSILTVKGIDLTLPIITVILIFYALILLRKSRRTEIFQRWKGKMPPEN